VTVSGRGGESEHDGGTAHDLPRVLRTDPHAHREHIIRSAVIPLRPLIAVDRTPLDLCLTRRWSCGADGLTVDRASMRAWPRHRVLIGPPHRTPRHSVCALARIAGWLTSTGNCLEGESLLRIETRVSKGTPGHGVRESLASADHRACQPLGVPVHYPLPVVFGCDMCFHCPNRSFLLTAH
jgi:hypothetical protein